MFFNITQIHDILFNLDAPNNRIIVPQHISRYALISAQSILMSSITGFYYKYYFMATILVFLYVSTLLHWYKVTYYSLIKIVDTLLAITCLVLVTFRESKRFLPPHRKLWYYSLCISLSAFTINELLFYYHTSKNQLTEFFYYQNTFVHMIFLHLLPNFVCIRAALLGEPEPLPYGRNQGFPKS